MKALKRFIVIFLLSIPIYTFAQTGITGGVFDYENKSFPLQKVNVRNLNNNKVVVTGAAGQFNIQANKGDLLEFSLPGYHTDTLYLTNLQSKTIYLPSQSTALKQVDVKGAKISEDLNLKDPNAHDSKRVTGIPPTGNNSRAGGIGLSFGGGDGKRQRAKVKALDEREGYETEINRNFSAEHITDLIKIKGQELKDFMNMYRPSVAKVKSDAPFNYDYYIAQAYQTWLKLPPEGKRLAPVPKGKDSN